MVFIVTRLGTLFIVTDFNDKAAMTTTRETGHRAAGRSHAALLLLCTAQFVAVLDANALIVALPLIGRTSGCERPRCSG